MPDKISGYITAKEFEEYCDKCNEICSRHCVIYRKADQRRDEAQKGANSDTEAST